MLLAGYRGCAVAGGKHPPRRQLIDPIDGMPVGDLCQDILKVGLGIYAVELCGLHQCIDGCCTITACVGTTEEVVLSSQRDATHGVLGNVVIGLENVRR